MSGIGTLSVVATPIGNLEDVTLRAIRTLHEADYILAEDTRVTKRLLSHYEIETAVRRYDAHASEKVHAGVLADLTGGAHVALVSDAGTPGISDPGVRLVARARAAGARIEAIPGPSALTAALSIAGLAGNRFTFLGYAPQKKGRKTFFEDIAGYDHPVVFFESTHRIIKTLEALVEISGERAVTRVIVAREMTKMYEEVVDGTPAEVLNAFSQNPPRQRGEFVLITP